MLILMMMAMMKLMMAMMVMMMMMMMICGLVPPCLEIIGLRTHTHTHAWVNNLRKAQATSPHAILSTPSLASLRRTES